MTGLGGGKSSKSGGSKSKGKSSKGDALHKKVSDGKAPPVDAAKCTSR